jgi:hypothetical protein
MYEKVGSKEGLEKRIPNNNDRPMVSWLMVVARCESYGPTVNWGLPQIFGKCMTYLRMMIIV